MKLLILFKADMLELKRLSIFSCKSKPYKFQNKQFSPILLAGVIPPICFDPTISVETFLT